MNRRTFLSALGGSLLAAPLPAEAQRQNRIFRVGFLRAGQPPKAFIDEFQQGLRELGYVAGQNIVIEYRFTDGSIEPLPRLAAELVRLKVDVILASTGPAAFAALSVTNTVPIVFVMPDPDGLGIVPNLAHPGGNVTGLAMSSADLPGKRLQLLKEVVPRLTRVAVLWHPANPTDQVQVKGAQASVGALDLQLQLVPGLDRVVVQYCHQRWWCDICARVPPPADQARASAARPYSGQPRSPRGRVAARPCARHIPRNSPRTPGESLAPVSGRAAAAVASAPDLLRAPCARNIAMGRSATARRSTRPPYSARWASMNDTIT